MHEPLEQERAYLLKQALRDVLNDPQRSEAVKALFKDAITEWLDEQWARFGRWSFRGLAGAAFVGVLYLYAKAKGLL